MKYTIDEVEKIYEESCKLMYLATLDGKYKIGNREGKKLSKIFFMMEKDIEWGQKCIDKMIQSDNVVLKTEMAAYSLALNYNIDRAVSVLEHIANDPLNGIFGFNAKMTLKVWKENGCLKIK